MAESLVDGEFWLPSKFLDDTLMESEVEKAKTDACYEFGYGFGVSSGSNSPVASVIGSTETETDEDDLVAEITRQIDNDLHIDETTKGWVRSGSPQSTLSPIGSLFGCREGPTLVTSSSVNWDSVYTAAGEVERTRMQEEAYEPNCKETEFFGPTRKPGAFPIPVRISQRNADTASLYQHQVVAYQKLQALQQLRQQMFKQQNLKGGSELYHNHQQHGTNQGMVGSRVRSDARTVDLPHSDWPTLMQAQQKQPQPRVGYGSNMHAVFLSNGGRRSECAGTGVFLPRHVGKSAESRKKPGVSTVLLPEKVVKALNLNLAELGPQHYQHHCIGGGFTMEKDLDATLRNAGPILQQRRVQKHQPTIFHNEFKLPQEWTY